MSSLSCLSPAATRLPPPRSPRPGFTLIELLTVIAIIGILAAIIIPVVGKVRQSARRAETVSNLRQVATGLLLIAAEEKNQLPYGSFANATLNPDNNWRRALVLRKLVGAPPADGNPLDFSLYPVLGSPLQRAESPNDNGSLATFSANLDAMPNVAAGATTPPPCRHLGSFTAPTRTFLVAEGTKNAGANYVVTFLNNATGNTPVGLYDNRVSVAFVDGHVDTRPFDTVNWPARSTTIGDPGYIFWIGR